ncbi:S8 family serine peptidase [Kribbella sp. NPDC051952]|uniref:S8 family peptidase n=1 Tax=Kribbella sp. NPDC051952 TaxID=3154851 RepID=UPI00342F1FED
MGLGLAFGTPAVADAGTPPSPRPQAKAASTTLTLITGDRVRVTTPPGGREQVTFQPGPGSSSDAALTSYVNGHTYVVPTSAAADVTAGRLDRTLFDVTTLIAEGDDDTKSSTLPVIIDYSGSAKTALGRARTAVPGTTGARVLTSIGARATRVQKNSAGTFWRSLTPGKTARVTGTVERVALDRRVKVSLDQSVPQIGAPAAWARGFTGKGVKIAVLDTGIDPTHPDLAGRIAATANFSDAEDVVDHFGHGTHVASIAAGTGAASGGKYKGVAPDATLLNGKVLDDHGNGYDSGVIAGMEWAAAQGASVVNLSLGSGPSDGTDEASQAVNRLSKDTGTLFVIAAGNCYDPTPQPYNVSAPAAADEALAVGNMQDDGSMNGSSCRGPRKGDGALKPEISAPGTDIVAARAAGTTLGEPVDEHYTTLTGTSMATPHVAGTAALLAQAHPDWKGDTLRARLISTADPQPGSRVDEQGAGRVDADQATLTDVTVDTGELELGKLAWPFPAKDEVSRVLTYHNPTASPVTLQLAASVDPAKATPTLSADHLVVPANGDAKVTVTADRASAGIGTYSGRVTATAEGADPLVTTFGWYAEPELYDLTVKAVMHDGSPANGDLLLIRLDGEQPDLGQNGTVPIVDGAGKVRVPPGRYAASTVLQTAPSDTTPSRFDLVTSGETVVSKDTTITLDARTTITTDVGVHGRGDLTAREAGVQYVRTAPGGTMTSGVSATGSKRVFAATRESKPTTGSAELSYGTRLEQAPFLASIIGGPSFPVLDFYFGPRFTGRKDLSVFDGGTGTPAELAGATGKLALIRTDDNSGPNGELTKNAEDAGAAAVILYTADVPGDGAVYPYWALGDNGEAKIPAMRTSRVSARQLLDRLHSGPVSVRITGQAVTPYVYDLLVPWKDQLPTHPVVSVKPDQLARIDETFGGQVPGVPVSESRTGTTPAGAEFGSWLIPTFPTPAQRTAYVLADRIKWTQQLVLDNGNANVGMRGLPTTYRPGERSSYRWMAPVANSGLPDYAGDLNSMVGRIDGGLSVGLSTFGHGRDQYMPAGFGGGDTALTVTRNGTEILSTTDSGGWIDDVPADAADYTIDLLAGSNPAVFKYSTKVATTWKFRSRGGDDERMPLVLVDLDVPQANVAGQVKTGKPVSIDLGLRHQAGSGTTAKLAKPTLEMSYDGTHWSTVSLTATGAGKYTAKVTHPVSAAGKSPSLRLHAADADGNSITQQITNAYGVK